MATTTTTTTTRRHLLLLLVVLSSGGLVVLVASYSSEDFNGFCNGAHIKDDHPLEKACKGVMRDLANRTPEMPGLRFCTAETVEGFTQHGSASCSPTLGTEGCRGCLNGATSYLLTTCADHLGGRTLANDGLCYMRFENYVYCDQY